MDALACPSLLWTLVLLTNGFLVQHLSSSSKLMKVIDVPQAPILEQANSTAAGLGTLAFGQTQRYLDRIYDLIDLSTRLGWHLSLAQRPECTPGNPRCNVCDSAGSGLTLRGASYATASRAIGVAIQQTKTLVIMLSKASLLEIGLYTVDSVLEPGKTPADELDKGDDTPHVAWPTRGAIEVDHLTVRYNPYCSRHSQASASL